jgi:hypothetical protein
MTTKCLHKEELQRQLQLQERELSAEFEKKVSLNQKLHQEEIENIKSTHAQKVTRLQGEQLEISTYNEKIEGQIQKLQQDNDLLEKTLEESKKGTIVLEIIKEEATRANEELRSVQKELFFYYTKFRRTGQITSN